MSRTIIHLDLDAFYCAVEELRDPSLRGKPFAVGGRPDQRGVVASCSYAARACGVHSAMPMGRALALCPKLIVISGRHRVYEDYSAQVMARLRQVTPLMEQISIDEAFLDVSDLPESGESIAKRLQAQIRRELNLPSSAGVASNKLVAKIANDVGKRGARKGRPPLACTVVPPGHEADFLAPLPCEMLWGVGPKTAAKLAALGIRTIGGIAAWPEKDLIRRFGEHGRDLFRHAQGVDTRAVSTEHDVKSISQETTFSRDVSDVQKLHERLRRLSAQVAYRLRKAELGGKTIKLKLRWSDFTTLTRQSTLPAMTDSEDEIYAAAALLLDNVYRTGRAVRLIGVGVSGLGPPLRQLALWDQGSERSRRLQSVIDKLREKYGRDAIRRGVHEA